MSYNKIILAGNLTRDIEIRYTQSGSAIANTGIATTRKFKAQDGTQKEETLFVDLIFFNRSAEIANQYLRKGSKILVDGRLKLDQWEAQDGSKRSKHSITVESMQMLGSKDDNSNQPTQQPPLQRQDRQYAQTINQNAQNGSNQNPSTQIPEIDINEDEIPF